MLEQIGFVTVYVEDLTPCLRDNESGKLVETEVVRITSKSFLKDYNTKTGWYVNWNKLASQYEIYGLKVKGIDAIQGLVAIYDDKDADAVLINWMCTAPHNNVNKYGNQKYAGVGGHLFSIAIKKSKEWGHDGCIYGFASDKKLLEHYVNDLGAQWLGMLHPNHFMIADEAANSIEEVYDYEWKDEKI